MSLLTYFFGSYYSLSLLDGENWLTADVIFLFSFFSVRFSFVFSSSFLEADPRVFWADHQATSSGLYHFFSFQIPRKRQESRARQFSGKDGKNRFSFLFFFLFFPFCCWLGIRCIINLPFVTVGEARNCVWPYPR